MNLAITQAPSSGILGGPFKKEFVLTKDGIDYRISVEQMAARKIEITSDNACDVKSILGIYYRLVSLMMLFDGEFYPIIEAMDGEIDITHSMQKRELASYHSADFMCGTGNTLINPLEVLSAELVNAWEILEAELDMVHKMFLYCVSSVKMPVDMKCAFLTETYIGLAELVASRNTDFVLPHVGQKESKLKKYLGAVIEYYGKEIFRVEHKIGIDVFCGVLKESRNRIAHIKAKQGKLFLNGAESVLYLCKLSTFYRVILLNMLEIPSASYESDLKKRIDTLNQWNGVLDNFIKRLQDSAKIKAST